MASTNHIALTVTAVPDSARAKYCDTLDIDHDNHVLYAGDTWSGGVDAFDISSPQSAYVTTLRLPGRFFGVAVASNLGKLFVGMSGSTVAVIDISSGAKTMSVAARIHTGGEHNVDLVDYVPLKKRLYAANRFDGFLVAIDAETNSIVGRIDGLGRGLEQPRFNPADGMVYLTDNKDNVLYQIDPENSRLVNTFEIGDACYPNGLAIDPASNRALLACSNRERPHTVIWNLNNQSIESVIEESGCGDGAFYEPSLDRFFLAASGFSAGPVVGIFGGDPVRLIANVPTTEGSSWVAYDRKNRVVYAPAISAGRPALVSFPMPEI